MYPLYPKDDATANATELISTPDRVIEAIAKRVVELLREKQEKLPEQRYLTAKEVSQMLGCSPKTICEWCHSGKLPNINTGTTLKPRFRIDPTDVEALKKREAPKPVKRQRSTAPSVI